MEQPYIVPRPTQTKLHNYILKIPGILVLQHCIYIFTNSEGLLILVMHVVKIIYLVVSIICFTKYLYYKNNYCTFSMDLRSTTL